MNDGEPVANRGKRKGKKRQVGKRPADGHYEPVRGAKLRGPVQAEPEPAPAPEPETWSVSTRALPKSVEEGPAPFGEADEDELRMLAALETMESPEADFSDDLADEASVTIIERATPFDMPAPPDNDGALPQAARGGPPKAPHRAPDVDAARHAAYLGLIEEAEVEIFDVPDPALPASPPRRR